jgi:hypothetical protein
MRRKIKVHWDERKCVLLLVRVTFNAIARKTVAVHETRLRDS